MRRKRAKTRTVRSRKRVSRKKAPFRKVSAVKPIGKVTHYFPKVKAGVIKLTQGSLALGEVIHIKGHTTDFKQKVASIQLNHVPLKRAKKGQEIGIRVKSRVRQNDRVYKDRQS